MRSKLMGVSAVCCRRARRQLAMLTVVVASSGMAAVANTAAGAEPVPAGGEFVPVTAATLVNTTSGIGWSSRLQPGSTTSVIATGIDGVPAGGVQAVMLHITTSHSARAGATRNGNVWAWPAGGARPPYAILANAPAGSVSDNTAIVQIGADGRISFYNGAAGTAVDVRADIEGYVTSADTTATGAAFEPLTPRRIIDTSNGTGGRSTPLRSGASWTFHALGAGGVPASGVSAVALNLGAHATSTNCWVQVQPAGTRASNAAYPRVDTYADYAAQELAVVAPSTSGNIAFSTNCAAVDVYADVEGYYLIPTDGSSGDVYVPITNPSRVIDTRRNVGITGKLTAGRVVSGTRAVAVTGVGEVPDDADAVALNVGAINATARGSNTIWTDGTARPAKTSTIDVEPHVVESNLVFVQTGPWGRIDVADNSPVASQANDLYVDIEGYFYRPASGVLFATPQYFPTVIGDTFYNTVGPAGDILTTANDTSGVHFSCTTRGSDIAILSLRGADPARLSAKTVNCMTGYGPRGGGPGSPDGCSWKTGGITRIGRVVYLAVARQLRECSRGKEINGLQPSTDASIIKSVDGGKTWTNPWGATARDGAAPPFLSRLGHYKAMFPGQSFSAPFFIQYGPGNSHPVDGADKYLYAVSNDGYAYNGNYLHLARVPLGKVQHASAWQFYHGRVGGAGRHWTSSVGCHPGAPGEARPEPAGDPVRAGAEGVRAGHVLLPTRGQCLPRSERDPPTRSCASTPPRNRGGDGPRCMTTPGSAASGVRRAPAR